MNRFDYVRYDDISIQVQDRVKTAATLLSSIIENELTDGRAKALALTKLEECYMWVGKAVRDEQISRRGSAPAQEERKDG